MKPARPVLLLGIPALVLGACSLLISFNPDGQPCDALGRCLSGYVCVDNVCHATDGGAGGCLTACDAGERCQPGSSQCVPDTCGNRLCPVGTQCIQASGSTSCGPIPAPQLGSACASDSQCDAGIGARFCFTGAVASGARGGHTGFCAERCSGSTCTTANATCAPYALGLDAGRVSLCLPPKLVTGCSSDTPCLPESFVCTVYDNAQLGPIGLCDAPAVPGEFTGQACSLDGGIPCANGLCVPRMGPSSATSCADLCGSSATCSANTHCGLVGLAVGDGGSRQIPVCVP